MNRKKLTNSTLFTAIVALPPERRTHKSIMAELRKSGIDISQATLSRRLSEDQGIFARAREATDALVSETMVTAFADKEVEHLSNGIVTLNQADSLVQKMITKAEALLQADDITIPSLVTAIEKLIRVRSEAMLAMADIKAKLPTEHLPIDVPQFGGDNVIDAVAEFAKFGGQR